MGRLRQVHCKALFTSTPKAFDKFSKCIILNKPYNNVTLKNKWATTLNMNLDEKDWINIFKVCFRLIKRNDLIRFQFRKVQCILGTNTFLHTVILSNSSACTFCNMSDRTTFYVFATCPKVHEFWSKIEAWTKGEATYYCLL